MHDSQIANNFCDSANKNQQQAKMRVIAKPILWAKKQQETYVLSYQPISFKQESKIKQELLKNTPDNTKF